MFGDLFDTIGGWIDTGVDFVAETIGYDDFMEDYTDDFYSAGDQLTDDVLGFIKKGAGAYMASQKGKPKGYTGPTAYQRLNPKSPYRAGKSKAGSKSYNPTSSGRIGYGNPNVETALKNLITRTNNQQLGNMFARYGITPNLPISRKTVGLASANLKKITGKKIKAE
jgi:hypothetical protein